VKRRQVIELIYEGLGKILVDKSFRLKKSEEGFVRLIPGGRQVIGVPVYDYQSEFEFSLTTCIRLEKVERILHLFLDTPVKDRSESYTTVARLEYFLSGRPSLFKVTNQQEIEEALAELTPIIRDKMIPFLDQNQDLKALDKIMNHAPKPVDTMNQPYRSMGAITLARLTENPDFDRLVVKYQEEIRKCMPIKEQEFNRFVEYLKESVH
jgi:hypothetical protein